MPICSSRNGGTGKSFSQDHKTHKWVEPGFNSRTSNVLWRHLWSLANVSVPSHLTLSALLPPPDYQPSSVESSMPPIHLEYVILRLVTFHQSLLAELRLGPQPQLYPSFPPLATPATRTWPLCPSLHSSMATPALGSQDTWLLHPPPPVTWASHSLSGDHSKRTPL